LSNERPIKIRKGGISMSKDNVFSKNQLSVISKIVEESIDYSMKTPAIFEKIEMNRKRKSWDRDLFYPVDTPDGIRRLEELCKKNPRLCWVMYNTKVELKADLLFDLVTDPRIYKVVPIEEIITDLYSTRFEKGL